MSSPPRVSVVMPVHNGMPYVEESIESILSQTFSDFELVIGDDASTDGTAEVLKKWAEKDSRIRLLRSHQKSGLAAAANWVVGSAWAPLVAIAHADDLSRATRLERQVNVLEAEPHIDLVGTFWQGIDGAGRKLRPGSAWSVIDRFPFAPFSHSSIMFRKTSFDRVGGYRAVAEFWEDLDLYLRLLKDGGIAILPEELSVVRYSPISERLRSAPERVEDAIDLMHRSIVAYAREGDYEQLLISRPARFTGEKLNPLTFVSLGNTMLWAGRPPAVWRRMRRRARLRPDLTTAKSVAWVLWGVASPRSLKLFLRALLHVRNLIIKRRVGDAPHVEWHPRRGPLV